MRDCPTEQLLLMSASSRVLDEGPAVEAAAYTLSLGSAQTGDELEVQINVSAVAMRSGAYSHCLNPVAAPGETSHNSNFSGWGHGNHSEEPSLSDHAFVPLSSGRRLFLAQAPGPEPAGAPSFDTKVHKPTLPGSTSSPTSIPTDVMTNPPQAAPLESQSDDEPGVDIELPPYDDSDDSSAAPSPLPGSTGDDDQEKLSTDSPGEDTAATPSPTSLATGITTASPTGSPSPVPTEEENDSGEDIFIDDDAATAAPTAEIPPGDSCDGSCGEQADSGCWCDEICIGYSDCCIDSCAVCGVACEPTMAPTEVASAPQPAVPSTAPTASPTSLATGITTASPTEAEDDGMDIELPPYAPAPQPAAPNVPPPVIAPTPGPVGVYTRAPTSSPTQSYELPLPLPTVSPTASSTVPCPLPGSGDVAEPYGKVDMRDLEVMTAYVIGDKKGVLVPVPPSCPYTRIRRFVRHVGDGNHDGEVDAADVNGFAALIYSSPMRYLVLCVKMRLRSKSTDPPRSRLFSCQVALAPQVSPAPPPSRPALASRRRERIRTGCQGAWRAH